MVGIILAGGNGTRLYPLTKAVSKQLLPLYSAPMLYHPLCTLMNSGIKNIIIITNCENVDMFKLVVGDGSQWGCDIKILPQHKPNGIAEAYLIAEPYIKNENTMLILGDNIFYGCNLKNDVKHFKHRTEYSFNEKMFSCMIYGYKVKDPERYGVIEFDKQHDVISIEEKPKKPKSNYAAVGVYLCDETAPERVKNLKPSKRGELEITDLMKSYMYDIDGGLRTSILNNDVVWLDAGTKHSYVEAINFVEAIEERTGKMIACPEQIAYENKFVTKEEMLKHIESLPENEYKHYCKYFLENC